MRRKAFKLRQFPLNGAKVNSTSIGTYFETYFVVGDSQNNIRLYSFESEEVIEVYSNPTNNGVQTEVTAVAFSCTEKQIFSGTNRGIINLWDMETAKSNAPLRGHSTAVNCFGIFPEEPTRIASGSYDTMIKLWDIREKNCTNTLKGHSKPINSIAISPDGNMLLSGSEDNTARLWELRMSQKPIYTANEHNGPIIKVKFNPEDCMFATCSMDKTAKYFRCQEKCYGFASSTDLIATPVTAIGFKEDGKVLFTAANDVLKSWNMYKSGMLIQTFDANWKGVQDISMIKGALMGVAFSAGTLSLWGCDVQQRKVKNNSQMEEGSSFVLPKISKNPNRVDLQNQIKQMQNLVGKVAQNVNNIEQRPVRDTDKINEQLQKRRHEMQKKRQQQQRRLRQLQEEREREKERLREQKLARQREEKQRKEQQRLRKIQQNRLLEEKLFQQRKEREIFMQEKVKKTLEENYNDNMENTLQPDCLDNSSLINVSSFMMDGAQKEKLRQFELIADLMKETSKYQSVLKDRSSSVKPIINFWKQGRIGTALEVLSKSKNPPVLNDCISSILSYPKFRSAITPEVAISLSTCLRDLVVSSKHATYLMGAIINLNSIVLLFKDQLIKIKNFSPMTRVDLSREQRIAKCDKLIDEFLTVFKLQRLKKYYERKRAGQEDELHQAAYDLYKNLQQVLIKIMPKKQPELA